MNKSAKIAELRHALARYGLPPDRPAVPLGEPRADAVLGGGLRRGALHEVFAQGWGGGGFALLLALRLTAAGGGPLFWVRSDYAALEYGAAAPEGIAALMPSLDAGPPVVVRVAGGADALAAAADILACPHVGCLLLEMEGNPRLLDLTASRRLALAAEESGVGLILLREGAHQDPSAAHTRWLARAAPSRADDDDWGNPRFAVELVRHRLGGLGNFLMEWDPQTGFVDPLRLRLPVGRLAPSVVSFGAPGCAPHPSDALMRMRGRRA
ncbi:MAG: DNA repair protein [Alphaproteobacteria bacterium]|nr:DNA repair protein [Alphaproteobacteria bacterium]